MMVCMDRKEARDDNLKSRSSQANATSPFRASAGTHRPVGGSWAPLASPTEAGSTLAAVREKELGGSEDNTYQ